jgi:acetyl-CoA carboxylase carboxyl transferase subunit alpha
MSGDEIFNHRKNKFLTIGRSKGFVSRLDDLSTLSMKKNKINTFIESIFKSKINLGISFVVIVLLGYLMFFL